MKKGDADNIVQRVVKEGTGPAIKDGDTITIHYKITSVNGDLIQDSRKSDEGLGPKTFKVGDKKAVIPGINAGVIGLKTGGKYVLTIPPKFGIQRQDANFEFGTPADFEIDILDVK